MAQGGERSSVVLGPEVRRDGLSATLRRCVRARTGGAVIQRMRMSQQQRLLIPHMTPRQLGALHLAVADEVSSLTGRINDATALRGVRNLQRNLLMSLDQTRVQRLRALAPTLRANQVSDPRVELANRVAELTPQIEEAAEHRIPRAALVIAPRLVEARQRVVDELRRAAEQDPGIVAAQGRIALGDEAQGLIQAFNAYIDQVLATSSLGVQQQLAGHRDIISLLTQLEGYDDTRAGNELSILNGELIETRDIGRLVDHARAATPMLTVAQDVIDEVQRTLNVGAGNQLSDLQRTAGLSDELVGFVRSIGRVRLRRPSEQIAQEALIAKILHAGNCGEHAALAFVLLWKRLPGVRLVYYSHRMDHAFVVIGDPTDRNAIVCDPWPRHAEAVTLNNFFVQTGLLQRSNIRVDVVSSGSDLLDLVKDTVDRETAEARMEEERQPLSAFEARQRWGGQRGIYQHDFTTLH